MKNLRFMIIGIAFGILLTKAEVISWFRIQEMFRFQSIHMYGVIGLAVLVGMISLQLIKRYNIKTIKGGAIGLADKAFHPGVYIGGTIFGLGWALTGACPAPLFALVGGGYSVIAVAIVTAVLGTWVYGAIREYLPH